MRRLVLTLCVLIVPAIARAQVVVVATSSIVFTSTDQTTIIPPGQTFAGQPTITSYQGMLFKAPDDPTSGVPVLVGPVVLKTAVVAQPASGPSDYKLTFTQLGILPPTCTILPCQQYTAVMVSIGPNGTSAKGVAAESLPFTAVLPVAGPVPAGPTNLRLVP